MAKRYFEPPAKAEDIQKYYDKGQEYNSKIDLTNTVETNRNFYVGKQWEERDSGGFTTATLNYIKPIIQIKVANVMSENVAIVVRPSGIPGAISADQEKMAAVLTDELNRMWEKQKLTTNVRKLLTDAAVDGDCCWHMYWNPSAPVASVDPSLLTKEEQPADMMDMGSMGGMGLVPETEADTTPQVVPEGDIRVEILRNTQVFFGNNTSPEVEGQPWILVACREYVPFIKKIAAANGVGAEQLESIKGQGDDYFDDDQDDRATILTLYYRDEETDTIWMAEAVDEVMLREPEDTGLTVYPVSWLCWEENYNSYHGEPAVTEMVNNQEIVNLLATMSSASVTRSAFPTVLYNKNALQDGFDNSIGAVIGVNGLTDMNNVVKVVEGANYGYQVDKLMQYILTTTRELNGANDVVMGNIKPENTSAIIAARKAATTPLGLVQAALYQFVEDWARIAIEFMRTSYGTRPVALYAEDGRQIIEDFPFDSINFAALDLKIDIGASSYWSEQTEVRTLDNLFMKDMIGPADYVDAMPATALPHKAKLTERLRQREEQAAMMQQQQMAMENGAQMPQQPGGIAPTEADLAGAVPTDRINQVISRQAE